LLFLLFVMLCIILSSAHVLSKSSGSSVKPSAPHLLFAFERLDPDFLNSWKNCHFPFPKRLRCLCHTGDLHHSSFGVALCHDCHGLDRSPSQRRGWYQATYELVPEEIRRRPGAVLAEKQKNCYALYYSPPCNYLVALIE
jgi:hypothetical protein